MTNGLYGIMFQGTEDFGMGACVVIDGIVMGADTAGGRYDGTCVAEPTGDLRASLMFTATRAMTLVQGLPLKLGHQFPILATLPSKVGAVLEQEIDTLAGPVSAQVRKLRDL